MALIRTEEDKSEVIVQGWSRRRPRSTAQPQALWSRPRIPYKKKMLLRKFQKKSSHQYISTFSTKKSPSTSKSLTSPVIEHKMV